MVMFFNVGKTMNEQQLVQTVELILQEYWWMRPAEFKYAFNKAKLGRYGNGKLYDRIDGAILFEWLNEYTQERDGYFVEENTKKNQQHKEDNLEVFKTLNKLNLFKNLPTEKKITQPPARPQTDREKTIQFYLRKFNTLREEKPVDKYFIQYKGKIMDCTQYCEKRLSTNKLLK